jgi:RecB family exonuclease
LADLARESGRTPGRETAVVLCDESLLTPLVWSMPPEVEGINITMGYPLRMHPSYTFVERLVELQSRRRSGRDSVAFYHSDVEGLLRHPYLARPGSPPPPPLNFVYVGAARLRTSPLFEKIFSAPEGWRALSDYLVEVLAAVADSPLAEGLQPQSDVVVPPSTTDEVVGPTAMFPLIAEHILRLKNSLEGCDIELSTKTWARLLRRTLQSVTVPFEGEPLEGVQVMGILETRALDFDNIIFLSAGDDKMPGSLVGAPSFIPYNLKAAYGLPTPEHHEGVYAYHFFRLVSRARHVDAVWSRSADDRSSGAPSRYLLQLDYESPHDVAHETVSVDVNLSPTEPITVEKGAEVMARLGEFLCSDDPRPLSPSLLWAYIECPLKFYFRGIARLRPEDEVAEEIDGALLGNILHHAMQLLYAPLAESGDPRPRIRKLVGTPAVEQAVSAAVTELYPGGDGDGPEDWGGAIMLAHKTIVGYINRGILPYDAALPESFTIVGLEKDISGRVSFDGGSVLFRGVADRVDRLPDGALRVVDYKTGNPKNNASALMQMGLYAMMLRSHESPALYYVRDMSRPDYSPPPVEQGEEFEENLHTTLAALFDSALPFAQTPDPKPCEWCDFRVICRR